MASKVEIKSLDRLEMTRDLLGKVMEWRVGCPGFNSQGENINLIYIFFKGFFFFFF